MSNPAARPPRSGWSNSSPLNNHARHKPGSAAAAAPSPPGRRARSPLACAGGFETRSSCPRARRPGASSLGEGLPTWGDPPDPPFKVCAALNGRPEGGRRAPRPGTSPPRLAPANKAGAALGLGAAPLSLRALVGADRPRPPRAPCSARAGGAGICRVGAPPLAARGP